MSDYKIEVKTIPAMTLAAISHTGPYEEIGKAFETLCECLANRNMIRPDTKIIGIFYDDPEKVPADRLRSYAGMTVDRDLDLEPPLEKVELRGGDYGVLIFKGPYTDLMSAYKWAYNEWLPQSGREPAAGPCFEEYLNSPDDTAPADLLTAIYMPLR